MDRRRRPADPVRSRLAELKRYDIGRLNPDEQIRASSFPSRSRPTASASPRSRSSSPTAGPDVRFNIEIKTDPTKPDLTLDPVRFAQLAVEAIRLGKAGGAQHDPVVRLARR